MPLDKPVLTFSLGLTAGFNDAWSTVVWEPITDYVVSWGTGRGRSPTKPPSHFEAGTAKLVLNNRDRRFDPTNTAGPYTPNLKPAKVRLRIQAVYATVTYDVFHGFVKRWPPQWTASATSTVEITAVDAMGAPLNLAQATGSIYQTAVRNDDPKVMLRLGESSGTVAADATNNHLDGQYQGEPVLGVASVVTGDTNTAVSTVELSRVNLPYKNLILDYPFTVECWFRATAARGKSRVIFSAYDAPGAPRQFIQAFIQSSLVDPLPGHLRIRCGRVTPNRVTADSSIAVDDGQPHHLVVVFTSSTSMAIWIDAVDRTSGMAGTAHVFPDDLITGYNVGNTPAVAFGDFSFAVAGSNDAIDEVAIYDYALSSARIAAHYAAGALSGAGELSGARVNRLLNDAGYPAADRLIDAGESLMRYVTMAAGITANLHKVEDSEQGAVFVDESGRVVFHGRYKLLSAPFTVSQATFGQGVGDLPYEAPVVWGNDDAELFNAASGSRVDGPSYYVEDAASAAEYGQRPLGAIDGLLNTTDGEVVDLLTYRVQRYAQPANTVRQVTLHPGAVPALYPYVLGLGLRSRITVKVAPPGGGPVFSQESHIERISHEVDASGDWWTTWEISAADLSVPNFLIADHATRGLLDGTNVAGF